MLKVPATISKITTMADGGLRLNVDTQELESTDKAELMSLYGQLGWFVFATTGTIKEEDIPTAPLEDGQKTPSQRLRSVLYVYYMKMVESKQIAKDTPFEEIYSHTLEKYIDHIKKKIDEV